MVRRKVSRDVDGVDDRAAVVADKVDRGSVAESEIRVVGAERGVAAGVEDNALARLQNRRRGRCGNMVLPQVVLVVGQIAAGELPASVGIVEDLDPAVTLPVAVRESVRVLDENLSDPEIAEILGLESKAGEHQDGKCE